MGSQGGCGGGGDGNGETQTRIHDPKSNGLAREGSLYSLTLDEVEQQFGGLGKPLCSMNLDELLKTVDYGAAPLASGDLSKKTVDEVWQDIQQGEKRGGLDRNASLGEMTLEDFLFKASLVADSSHGKKGLGCSVQGDDDDSSTVLPHHQTHGTMFHVPPIQQPRPPQNHHQQQGSVMAAFMDTTYPGTQITTHMDHPLIGMLSDTQTLGRKRVALDNVVVERSVERRQKRMIKNRESAARSRARKQAYTNELENKISRLEEENARLRREKEIEKALPTVPPPEPKYQLRRTNSALF